MRCRNRAREGRPPDSWEWNILLTRDQLAKAGETTLDLVQYGERWVNRRVNRITFLDDKVARRQMSVDFRLPRDATPVAGLDVVADTYFVPLTVLRRDTALMKFDLRDERGWSLPLLTRRENSRISSAMLDTGAKRILEAAGQGAPVLALREALWSLPMVSTKWGQQFARAILDPESKQWKWKKLTGTEGQRNALRSSPEFVNLVNLLIGRTVILAPIEMRPGERRIVKLSYEDQPDREKEKAEERTRCARFLALMGWSSRQQRFDAPFVGSADTFHVEIESPADVEMTEAGLLADRPRERIEAQEPNDAVPQDGYQENWSGPSQRAHLYVDQASRICTGMIWVGLRAKRRGFLRGALVASCITAAVLTFFAIDPSEILKAPSSATSLLLLVPALLVAYTLRPDEHEMARSLYGAARLFLALSGLAALIGAALVLYLAPVGEPPTVILELRLDGESVSPAERVGAASISGSADEDSQSTLPAAWISLAAFSWAMAILLLIGNAWPRPGGNARKDS